MVSLQLRQRSGRRRPLGIALSPNFATDHWVYLYHTAANDNRIARMKYENGVLASTSSPVLTGLAKNRYHNGGRIGVRPGREAVVTGEQLWVTKINSAGTGVGAPQAVFCGRCGRLHSVTHTPDGELWLTSTNNDTNGGTPSAIDNVIVRLKFPDHARKTLDQRVAGQDRARRIAREIPRE